VTWTGIIDNTGKVMNFTGHSLQHIESQIRAENPKFDWSMAAEDNKAVFNAKVASDYHDDILGTVSHRVNSNYITGCRGFSPG